MAKQEYVTPIGIVFYPYLAEKDEGRVNSSNKYKLDLFIDPAGWGTEEGKALIEAVKELGKNHFKGASFKSPFTEVDTLDAEKKGNVPPELLGKGYVRIRPRTSFDTFAVFGPDMTKLTTEAIKDYVKPGTMGRAVVTIGAYPQSGGGVTMFLQGYQHFKKAPFEITIPSSGGAALLGELEVPLTDLPKNATAPESSVFGGMFK